MLSREAGKHVAARPDANEFLKQLLIDDGQL